MNSQHQQQFHSIWSASQNTGSNSQFRMENSFQQQQKYVGVRPMDSFGSQPVYGNVNNNNYYYSGTDRQLASQSQSQSQANKENISSMQQHDKCKKTFAGLFQSTTDAPHQTNHNASFLSESNEIGNGGIKPQGRHSEYLSHHPSKQREDAVRYSYLTKKYHSDMQGLGNYHNGNNDSVTVNATTEAAMPVQHRLAMQEMNERIQTVTKMLMNMKTDLNSKLTDLDADVKSHLKGMHSLSEKYHEIKDIAQENQYLVKLSASKQERYYSMSQEQQRRREMAEEDSKNSLWSREPESYLHTSKFEPEQDGDLTGSDACETPVNKHSAKAARYDDSDEIMHSNTQDGQNPQMHSKAEPASNGANIDDDDERDLEREQKPQEKGTKREPEEGSDQQQQEQNDVPIAKDSSSNGNDDSAELQQDHLSVTSEDEIEEDFGDLSSLQEDPSQMTHCIRKRISRYLDSQLYQQTNNK